MCCWVPYPTASQPRPPAVPCFLIFVDLFIYFFLVGEWKREDKTQLTWKVLVKRQVEGNRISPTSFAGQDGLGLGMNRDSSREKKLVVDFSLSFSFWKVWRRLIKKGMASILSYVASYWLDWPQLVSRPGSTEWDVYDEHVRIVVSRLFPIIFPLDHVLLMDFDFRVALHSKVK